MNIAKVSKAIAAGTSAAVVAIVTPSATQSKLPFWADIAVGVGAFVVGFTGTYYAPRNSPEGGPPNA